jgi:hypothetical protein
MHALLAQQTAAEPAFQWFDLLRNPESAVFVWLTILSLAGMVAGIATAYFRHREKMLRLEERIAMIEHGFNPDAAPAQAEAPRD